jgi:hypothetical protein
MANIVRCPSIRALPVMTADLRPVFFLALLMRSV